MADSGAALPGGRRDYPGFDLVRIVAALAVVFSHSFLIAETNEAGEPLQRATGEILGVYGVYVFFILSGFLVTDSALNTASVGRFANKRARRILPAFIVANLVMVAIVSPFFAPAGAADFLFDLNTWRRLFDVLTLQEKRLWYESVEFYPGGNPAGVWLSHSINGVLWTIRLEIACYAVVGFLMALGWLRPNVSVGLVFAGVIYAFQYDFQPGGLGGFALLFPSFAAGMAMRLHAGDHRPVGRAAFLSLAGLLLAMFTLPGWHKIAPALFPLFACYPLLWFGAHMPRLRAAHLRNTDPSYGIYIWGWPVQQLLLAGLLQLGLAGISGWAFAALAMPVAYLAGIASWHLIERPFLARRPHGAAAAVAADGGS